MSLRAKPKGLGSEGQALPYERRRFFGFAQNDTVAIAQKDAVLITQKDTVAIA